MSDKRASRRFDAPEGKIWSIVCGLPEEKARRKQLLMLTLYVDDSGKKDHSPVQVLAGYLSTAERWAAFSNEWDDLLKDAGLKSFRMTEAWRMSRRYHRIGALRRDELLVRAIECIKRHAQKAFVTSLPFAGFDAYLNVKGDHGHPLGRPYFFGFYALLTQVYKHAYLYHYDQPIEIVFDEQGGESEQFVLGAMYEFRRMAGQRFGDLVIPSPMFRPDHLAPPLQAADMLAWLVRRDASNGSKGVDRSNRLENILLGEALSMPYAKMIFDQPKLEAAARQMFASLGLPTK